MNAKKVLEMVKELGIYGLAESDGCPCCNLAIHGVHVDVSCHKSEHTIRVYSHHLLSDPFALEPIAQEVHKQIGITRDYKIRFCEYSCDHVNGRWEGKYPNSRWVKEQKCCYCSAPRPDESAYLCQACLKKPEARGSYPWGLTGDMESPEEHHRKMFAPLLEMTEIHIIGEKELREIVEEITRKPQ